MHYFRRLFYTANAALVLLRILAKSTLDTDTDISISTDYITRHKNRPDCLLDHLFFRRQLKMFSDTQ